MGCIHPTLLWWDFRCFIFGPVNAKVASILRAKSRKSLRTRAGEHLGMSARTRSLLARPTQLVVREHIEICGSNNSVSNFSAIRPFECATLLRIYESIEIYFKKHIAIPSPVIRKQLWNCNKIEQIPTFSVKNYSKIDIMVLRTTDARSPYRICRPDVDGTAVRVASILNSQKIINFVWKRNLGHAPESPEISSGKTRSYDCWQ